MSNRTLISSHIDFIYAEGHNACPNDRLECFLQPFSSCSFDMDARRQDLTAKLYDLEKLKHKHQKFADPLAMPYVFARNGYFWFRVQVCCHLALSQVCNWFKLVVFHVICLSGHHSVSDPFLFHLCTSLSNLKAL